MHSPLQERQLDRPDSYHSYYSYYGQGTFGDRLQQPSVILPLLLLLLTLVYQALHSSPFSQTRHPAELLWGFIIAVTPARVLYALDNLLHPPAFPVPKSTIPAQSRTYAAKSDALRRILGMDKPDGIISSVARAGRRSFSTLSSNPLVKRNTDQPPGLGNYDNSCFQNSILQGLASLKPLPAYLEEALGQREGGVRGDDGSANTLRELISKLTDADNNGATLWTPQKLKSLDTWEQQDAQEYFSKILDEVDKEVTKAAKTQYRPPGLETASIGDDTEASQHSDDSGYQSLSVLSKTGSEVRLLRNPLEGLVAQRVACVQCGYSEGLSMIPFNCLTMNLGLEQMGHDLYERLDSYTDLEAIEGVECAKCTLLKVQRLLKILIGRGKDIGASDDTLREPTSRLEAVELALEEDDFEEETLADKCKISKQHRVSSTKTKQMVIARPPQSLAIHINRSVFDERTGNMFKNLAAVRFPGTLDLGPWCLGSAGDQSRSVNGRGDSSERPDKSTVNEEEQWISDARSSMISGDLKPSKITGPVFELRAVITHQGRHENGHYVCFRRHPHRAPNPEDASDNDSKTLLDEDGSSEQDDEKTLDGATPGETDSDPGSRWWRLSDESVWEVSEDTVLAQGGAFMLFYDCVDPNSVLVSADLPAANGDDRETITLDEANIDKRLAPGVDEAGVREEVFEDDEHFHDATSDVYEPGRAAQVASFSSDRNGSANSDDNPSDEGENTQAPARAGVSSLLPCLADGERVDPVIPLHRPNC